MAAQQAGLKTQECQRNLSAIYIGRNQNSINNIAWVKVGPCSCPFLKNIGANKPRSWNCGMKITDHRRTQYSTLTYFKQISMKSCWTFIVSDVKKPITSTGQSNLMLWASNYKVSFVTQLLSFCVFLSSLDLPTFVEKSFMEIDIILPKDLYPIMLYASIRNPG